MFTTTLISPVLLRGMTAMYAAFQKFLMVAGLIFVAGLVVFQSGHGNAFASLQASSPNEEQAQKVVAGSDVAETINANIEPDNNFSLSPKMRAALDFVSRKYRVADEALLPIFEAAETTGKELKLDPLLIVAVIGVESGFNPFSQSGYGAQGLMQVVPRFHKDKLPDESDESAFLDPVTNVQIGARVLHESIRRYGNLTSGLQQFGGALNDTTQRYANKVLAEMRRLEQAPRQRT